MFSVFNALYYGFSVTINEKIIKAISAISGSSAEEKEKAVENAKNSI